MKKWNDNEEKYLVDLLKSGSSIKNIAITLDRTHKSIERKISILGYRVSDYKKSLLISQKCKKCCIEFNSLVNDARIFCSKSCANSYSNSNRTLNYMKTKEINCISCNDKIVVKINSDNLIKCKKCSLRKCKYCDSRVIDKKQVCNVCILYSGYILFYKKLKLYDINSNLLDINKKAVDLLEDMYYKKKYSRLQISQLLNIDKKTLFNFFKRNNFELRNLSDSLYNAVSQGRMSLCEVKSKYKTGYHKSWQNKTFYYRSSYELKYCEYLDSLKIKYDMESKRIEYYDSVLKRNRTAIPDFYLPDTNEIVEIKSSWTYDEQNMIDKSISYKKSGYNVRLILEKLEYIL